MSLVIHLVGFGLRQVIGDTADTVVSVVEMVERRFRDHSGTLPKALDQAHDRAWQALGVALAGDGLVDRVKVFFASGDDKGVREQVQLFLRSNAASFDGAPAEFRQSCLDELKRLRKSGLLSAQAGSAAEIARQAAGFRRHADPHGLVEESRRAVAGVAEALGEGYPNLAKLLRTPTPSGPPLLAAAFCYFFRREVETDDELAHGLLFDGLRQLSASQAKAFGEVGKALDALGGHFDAVFEQLGRVEAAVGQVHAVAVETHGAVLDLQDELRRLGGLHLSNAGEVRTLLEQVLYQLGQAGMARGEVRPGNSCSIRGEDERRAVKALLARFRSLPAEEQRQAPALLNGLGKLQVGAGDFAEARRTFTEVVRAVGDASGKAEASFNAYRAALEENKWDAALAALGDAASLDPQRFAPFPLHRYEPKRVLGAGGFGAAVLCHDRNFDEDVVVKTLHPTDLARGMDTVFGEARILRRLSHPAIIGVRDCEYADPAHKGRPYLVMDHFPGGTLQQFVEQRGPLNLEQMLAVAVQMAEGMRAAHAQGVLHRDLKPANLLVRKEGNLWTVKIIDFGLALRQQTVETSKVQARGGQKSMLDSSVAGTLDYAPPEQLGKLPGVSPGPYSDAYAFARTCCFALFKATELRRKQWDSLPRPLADLLEGCLDPDPRQRPKCFEPVIAILGEHSRKGQETSPRAEEEQLRRAQEEQLRRQKISEEGLAKLVRAALDRTGGDPTPDDTTAVKELCRRHKLTADRVTAVIREVNDVWEREREARNREQQRQETSLRVETAKGSPQLPIHSWDALAEQAVICEIDRLRSVGKESGDYLKAVAPGRLRTWRTAAESGLPEAQYLLGVCLLHGSGAEANAVEGMRWLHTAAEQGYTRAQVVLGARYLLGDRGVKKDYGEALRWLYRAIEQGCAAAHGCLGLMYAQGWGVEKDEAMAAQCCREAAEQGIPVAQYELGELYANGQGVPKDERTAVQWYRKAAEQGVALAQYRLGLMYAKGRGVPEDEVTAAQWYCEAAEQGIPVAQYNLGLAYANGQGVPKDERMAAQWFRKAAEQGVALAKFKLRELYLKGPRRGSG